MHVLTINTEHEPGSVAVVEVDEQATYRWRRSGRRGFVCRYCAETVGRETPVEVPS